MSDLQRRILFEPYPLGEIYPYEAHYKRYQRRTDVWGERVEWKFGWRCPLLEITLRQTLLAREDTP